MSLESAGQRLAALLREENALLAANETDAAVLLVADKQAALTALERALPGSVADPALASELRALAVRNRALLAQAIQVQGRVLEMVARAARAAAPGAVRYGAGGSRRTDGGALALVVRA